MMSPEVPTAIPIMPIITPIMTGALLQPVVSSGSGCKAKNNTSGHHNACMCIANCRTYDGKMHVVHDMF